MIQHAPELVVLMSVWTTLVTFILFYTIFRDVSALHFDPNREDHTLYEVKDQDKVKKDK